jgi:hypothetical protein
VEPGKRAIALVTARTGDGRATPNVYAGSAESELVHIKHVTVNAEGHRGIPKNS